MAALLPQFEGSHNSVTFLTYFTIGILQEVTKPMNKGLVLGILAIAAVGFAGMATAGLPCAAYSTCDLAPVQIRACSTTDVIWDAVGAAGYIGIVVTVRDCLNNPVDACDVRLDMSGTFDSNFGTAGVSGVLCGTGSMTGTTDANGAVSFDVYGGGCGVLVLDWTATALCATPEVELCNVSDTLCVKSTDFNGDGLTHFLDTFRYLPMLNATTGYCGDFAGCSAGNGVNFLDTFAYLPALGGPYGCLPKTILGNSGGGLTCDAPMQ